VLERPGERRQTQALGSLLPRDGKEWSRSHYEYYSTFCYFVSRRPHLSLFSRPLFASLSLSLPLPPKLAANMEDNQGSIPTPQLPQPADSLLYCEMPVPVAVMQAVPLSTLAPFAEQMPENMEPGGKEEQVLPFVQKLRDLEQSAKAEMAAWDPAFSQVAENGAATVVSTKRKGIVLNRKGSLIWH
jgi:hypothetical protein